MSVASGVSLLVALQAIATPNRIYETDPVADLAAAAALLGAVGLLELEKTIWSGASPCGGVGEPATSLAPVPFEILPDDGGVCDSSHVNDLDRWSIGASSKTAEVMSDVLLWGLVASPFVAAGLGAAFDGSGGGGRSRAFMDEGLVALESVAGAALTTTAIKLAFKRPRPLAHDPNVSKTERFDGDARLSFPSGHTAVSFAAATVLSVTLFERGSDRAAWASAVLAYAGSAAVGGLRIAAGKHFLSDVVAGAALGLIVGLGVTRLYGVHGSGSGTPSRETRALEPRHDVNRLRVLAFGGQW